MDDELKVSTLYQEILNFWNESNAHKFAARFEKDGTFVQANGSQHVGRTQIESDIRKLFRTNNSAVYIGLAREVRHLSSDIRLVRAVAGMIPPGKSNIDPSLNTVQVLIARKYGDGWCITHFQNTPMEFYGRREMSDMLAEELVNSLDENMREKLRKLLEKKNGINHPSGANNKNGKNNISAKDDKKDINKKNASKDEKET